MTIRKKTAPNGTRVYYIDGTPHPSVTTVLGIVGGKGLINWAVKETADYLELELSRAKPYEVKFLLPDIIQTARNRHHHLRNAGGARGTDLHKIAETVFRGKKVPENRLEDPVVDRMVEKLVAWRDEWGFETLTYADDLGIEKETVEIPVYSKEHGFAGTADLIGRSSEGTLMLLDLKTGKSVHKTMALQMAAYAHAYGEMTSEYDEDGNYIEGSGQYPELCMVLHVLPTGNVKEKHILDAPACELHFQKFLNILEFYKWYVQ